MDVRGTVRQVLHERELTTDEIIGELLARQPIKDLHADEEKPAKRKYTKHKKGGFIEYKPTGKTKPCCGSRGARHMRDCPEKGTVPHGVNIAKPKDGMADKTQAIRIAILDAFKEWGSIDDGVLNQIAEEHGTSSGVVRFVKTQMKQQGLLD